MNKLMQSLDTWFKGLTYPQKFTVITIIFVFPVIAFLPLIGNEVSRINRYGTNELFGTLYTRPLWKIAHDLYLHEVLSEKFAEGEVELSAVEALQATIDTDFAELEARQRQEVLSQPYQSEVAGFKERWENIKGLVSNADPAALNAQHESLINDFNDLILRVGESSNLVLDPDLDTYFMKDVVLFDMTKNQALTFEIYQLANGAEVGQPLSAREQEQIAGLLSDIETNMAQIDRKTSGALENNTSGEMGQIITPALDEYRKQMQSFVDFVQNNVISGSVSDSSGMLQAFENIHKANQDFFTAASDALQTGVAARVNSTIFRFYPIALIVLISVAAAFLLGQRMMGSISEPLTQLSNATQQLATSTNRRSGARQLNLISVLSDRACCSDKRRWSVLSGPAHDGLNQRAAHPTEQRHATTCHRRSLGARRSAGLRRTRKGFKSVQQNGGRPRTRQNLAYSTRQRT